MGLARELLEDTYPERANAPFALARNLIQLEDPEDAVKLLDESLGLALADHMVPDAHLARAELLTRRGAWGDAAIDAMQR